MEKILEIMRIFPHALLSVTLEGQVMTNAWDICGIDIPNVQQNVSFFKILRRYCLFFFGT